MANTHPHFCGWQRARVELENLLMTFRRIFKYGFSFRCLRLNGGAIEIESPPASSFRGHVICWTGTIHQRKITLCICLWIRVAMCHSGVELLDGEDRWTMRIWWNNFNHSRGRKGLRGEKRRRNVSNVKNTQFIVLPDYWVVRRMQNAVHIIRSLVFHVATTIRKKPYMVCISYL